MVLNSLPNEKRSYVENLEFFNAPLPSFMKVDYVITPAKAVVS